MLVFIVPIQSQQVSKSWLRVSQLFDRCIRSVCNQTSDEFRVIVVCHERPETNFNHPNLTYVQADFPAPIAINAGRNSAGTNSPEEFINHKRTDKGRKMLKGLVAAQQFNPSHTMFVDADDCVSNKLAAFVEQHSDANGWFVSKGYRHEEGSPAVHLKARNFYRMCGTCNIVRYDLNRIPETPQYDRGYGYYKRYIDHAKVRQWLAEEGTPLAPLPFAGAVYMTATGENTYFESNRLHRGVFRLLSYRPLSRSIRDEFCLHSIR